MSFLLGLLLTAALPGAARGATAAAAEEEMSLLQSVVLGVVEGLTEYLPVSSTGHLILTQRAMGIGQTQAADAYAICIQAGAILAVVGLYFGYVRSMTAGLLGRDPQGLRLLVNSASAFLPAAVLGFLLLDVLQEKLFGLWPIVAAWFAGGVAILAVAWRRRGAYRASGLSLHELTWRKAFLIGLMQCAAVWPGTSRSLVTIVGGVLVGLKLRDAVIFSFILGAITLTAVTLYELAAHGPAMLAAYGAMNLAAGFVAAAVSATAAVEWMVGYLKRHGLELFGYYRVVLALLVAALLLSGVMTSR